MPNWNSLTKLLCIAFFTIISYPIFAQKDTIPPIVKLKGDSVVTLEVYSIFKDPGVTITDNKDKINTWDSTGTFYQMFPNGKAIRLGLYSIIYIAIDSAGNKGYAARTINVLDTILPVIKLKGDSVVCIHKGEMYLDSGYIVTDNYWKPADLKVVIHFCKTLIDTGKVGLYHKRFEATDASGNIAYSGWRHIFVKAVNDTSKCRYVKDTACFKYPNTRISNPTYPTSFQLYPNPAYSKVIIVADPSLKSACINLFDLSGHQMLSRNATFDSFFYTTVIDLSTFSSGIYIVELKSEQGTLRKRLMIAR